MSDNSYVYKVEDIFEDIEGDPNNVLMNIPPEILKEKGWGEGTRIKIYVGDQGTIIIEEITDQKEIDGQE